MILRKVNAFTTNKQGGNPAGVVFDAPTLSPDTMKQISKTLAVSETAFFSPSTNADYYVRFFSPTTEIDLCGHATIASFHTLAEITDIPISSNPICLTQETKAGILPIDLYFTGQTVERVMMTQAQPVLRNLEWDANEIASLLGIHVDGIDHWPPKQCVSTGLFTLPICVHNRRILSALHPDFSAIKRYCQTHKIGSFHVFCFDTIQPASLFHARNFAPCYGINEDPVTGTASGAVAWYLQHYNLLPGTEGICEQGDIMGRPGRVQVAITEDSVQVGGQATVVEEHSYDVEELH